MTPPRVAVFNSLVSGICSSNFKGMIFKLKNSSLATHCENAVRGMPLNLTNKSTLVQVMAWCHQVTTHYLSQCWSRSLSPYSVTRPQWVNQLLSQLLFSLIIPPTSTKLKGGYTCFTLSVCPSVHLSVCGQNRVRSVSSTILIGSISYLHILSSNFRRCVACNDCFKI